ncbi:MULTISPECIES: hypothetical protein [Komagataeibacter]|uniref:Uncharacterized protein n=1 Tax=Komagataeibacter oboediens TaxID=65958 RepID=A0A318QR36_9PROT|nr:MULTISPECIES: hypothetical protein [Komagataeibacter]PYD79782.1 hypothetical protein CFR80_14610 [Komagataeibacter oboediens]GBQ47302.1 hypothetical protein AA18890_2746 [Komagataeibacter europaeus LMG 18890]
MKNTLKAVSLVVLGAVAIGGAGRSAHAQGVPYIDPAWKATETEMKAEQRSRCREHHLTIIREMNCRKEVFAEYRNGGNMPGTMAYVQKHYGSMSVSDLNAQIKRLNGLYGRVRMVGSYPAETGEITYEMVQLDVNFIRQLINAKGGLPPLLDLSKGGQ